jgi:alpha-ketoglutarate-dependent taurine dioxygenase
MNITLDKNGWTVIVRDFDISKATKHDIDILGCLVASQTLVIIKGPQNLTIEQEERIAKSFGITVDQLPPSETFYFPQYHQMVKEGTHPFIIPGSTIINRVSAQKDDKGRVGLFGNLKVHGWHCNKIGYPGRRGIVWLRGMYGTKGSETWFTNHIAAYQDMPTKLKERLQGLHIIYKAGAASALQASMEKTVDKVIKYDGMTEAEKNYRPPVIHTAKSGITGLSLSWAQFGKFEELSQKKSDILLAEVKDFVLGNPKYMYKFNWEDGDLLLADQWFGVHMRPEFHGMENRLLHRIETDYDHIDFSKMPQALQLLQI